MKEILNIKNLCKNGILNNISFKVYPGEMVAVMGPSGSGKSTLLYNVSGMDEADSGEAWYNDKDVVAASEDEKAKLRLNRMGFVFQQMNVLSNLNIIDNISFPAIHALGKKKEPEIKKRAMKLMEEFDIADLANRMTNEVSGGQLQRACICRSMMLEPDILFADEPTGALNQSATKAVMDAFVKLNDEGTTVLMVTHDSKVAGKCDRVLYILDGELKGELKFEKELSKDSPERDTRINNWLTSLGW